MLSAKGIVDDGFAHIRVPDDGATAEQKAYALNTFNRVLERMHVECPQAFKQTLDATWTASKTGTISVTNGSKAMTLGTMTAIANGCSILIQGDLTYNEVVSVSGSTYTLLFPYTGPTGTTTTTAWGDSVVLPTTADHVIGAMLLHERRPLQVYSSREDWARNQGLLWDNDYGWRTPDSSTIFRTPSQPYGIWLETAFTGTAIEYRARCAPLPNGTYRATLEVNAIPSDAVANDIASGDPVYKPVPGGRVYGILRALYLYQWSSSPWFRNESARAGINQDYLDAVQQLKSFSPNARAHVRVQVCY